MDVAGAIHARALRRLGLPGSPKLLTLNVTGRCNCRCGICAIHSRKTGGELTTAEIEKVLSDPVLKNLDALRITGGEPFLRSDLLEICAAASSRANARIIYITTNGTMPDEVGRFVRAALPSSSSIHIQVSVDALDARHDEIRGLPGSLDSALKSLRILADAKKRNRFHFGINQTVLADTLDQMRPVNMLARELGAGHNIILGAKYHEGKNVAGAISGGRPLPFEPQAAMTAGQVERFYEESAALKKELRACSRGPVSFSSFLRDLSEEYLNEGGKNRILLNKDAPAPPCMAMFAHARVMPSGDVIACSVLADKPAGNVRSETFSSIWNSSGAANARKAVAGCPGCWIECDINPSIFYSGDIAFWTLRRFGDREFRAAFIDNFSRAKYTL